jgi:hypothetical protein
MITDEEKLGNVKAYLQNLRADFCLVYRGTENKEVHWIRPMSYASETCADCAELATKYLALATHRWQEKQSAILEEKKGTEGIPWFGFETPMGNLTSFPANSLGERWWTVIVVSGTTPQLGYVIATRIPAKEPNECRKCILDIQAIVCPYGNALEKTSEVWHSKTCLPPSFPFNSFSKAMNQLDNSDLQRFQSLNEYLWKHSVDFCLVYRKKKWWNLALSLRCATSVRYKSLQEGEEWGKKYRDFATICYYRRLDSIIEEMINPWNKWVSVTMWRARLFKTLRILTPTPTNSIGQRWWLLGVASGPTRKSGYSIVTRVAARDVTELRQYIKDIQKIMRGELPPAEGEPRRV